MSGGLSFEAVPGGELFCAAAAALQIEYTLPGVSQTVIIADEGPDPPGAGTGKYQLFGGSRRYDGVVLK